MNDAPSIALLCALLFLLVIIAFSSGTEVAMLSVNRYRVKHRAQQGQKTAKVLEGLLQKPDDWLGANLVILAAASVFASSIATILAQRTGYYYAVPVTGFVLTVVVIVFCELTPKIYAATYPEAVALSAARIYRALVLVARPVLWLTNKLAYGAVASVRCWQDIAGQPVAEYGGAAHGGRRSRPDDPGAPPADAVVDPGSRPGHRE